MNAFGGQLKKWRRVIAVLALALVLAFFVYWIWQNWNMLVELGKQLGWANFLLALGWIEIGFLLAVGAFVVLTRSVRASFSFADGYHAFNFAQVASTLPGGVWGIAGLAGWLWGKGLHKGDSAMLVTLNLVFSLGACVLFAGAALAFSANPVFGVLALIPLVLWFWARKHLDALRARFFPAAAALPLPQIGLRVMGLDVFVWSAEAFCFAWFVFLVTGLHNVSPLLVAGAYAVAYLAGFVVIIAPQGLGVREGVLVALLGNTLGAEQIFAVALIFRFTQTVALWLNVLISWTMRFGISATQQ